jgi:hypothetical protein
MTSGKDLKKAIEMGERAVLEIGNSAVTHVEFNPRNF